MRILVVNDSNTSVQVYVTYEGLSTDRFDRDHYVNHHLPLVRDSWTKYGLVSARAFFPADDANGTIAVCECLFRDEAAVEAAFSSSETTAVMADVPLVTELAPKRTRAFPL